MDLARVFFFWGFKMIHKKTLFFLSPQEFRLIRLGSMPKVVGQVKSSAGCILYGRLLLNIFCAIQ